MQRKALILLIVAVTLAAAQTKPINEEPTNLAESECYRCHEQGGGSFGPPLQAMYYVQPPEDLDLEVGTPFAYKIEVQNGWTAELRDLEAVMDLTNAPSFGFSSGQEPTKQSYGGSLALTPALDERSTELTIDVPLGVTDLLISLQSTTQGALAPDLNLRVWPGTTDTGGAPVEAAANGAGARESIHIRGANTLADIGYGQWAVAAVQAQPLLSPSGLQTQEFTLTVEGWFNATAERTKRVTSPEILDGQDETAAKFAPISWTLLADQSPGDEVITITVNGTAFYDHPGSTSEGFNLWRYTQTVRIPVQGGGVEGGDEIVFVNDDVPVVEEAGVVVPWDIIGEVMGYFSTFLILISVYTGGMFGKATRRQQNKLFGNAKRRIAFHNFLSYGIITQAILHTIVFIFPEKGYPWTLGIIWGGIAILCMIGLGITGALQVPMIRKWNFATWRWWHFGLAIGVMLFTVVHILLDGVHFAEFAESIGWKDPFA